MLTLGKLATALLLAVATQQVQAVPILSSHASVIALQGSASLSAPSQAASAPVDDFADTALAARAAQAAGTARPGMAVDAMPPVRPSAYSLLLLGAGLLLLSGRRRGGPWTHGRVR
ncbi:MAG: hypothetical protein V4754_20405 [Pseudomonadota bacterium]